MRRLASLVSIVVLTAALIWTAIPAFSQVATNAGFEDADGNLAPNPSGINFDWNSFAPTWTGTAPNKTGTAGASGWMFAGLTDAQVSSADTGFAGGTKQDDNCPSVITAKAGNKEDLKRIYIASKSVGGHVYLMLGWVRIPQNTTTASAHVAFEFNQADAAHGGTACGGSSGNLVNRQPGDMLLVYDFNSGSPSLGLSRWIASGTCEISTDSAPCWGTQSTLAADVAEGAVDTGLNGLPSTAGDTIAPASETLGTNEFGEAGVDLTRANVFPANTCLTFGKAWGVSRTSGSSAQAQMGDLVGPGNLSVSNCGSVSVTKSGSDGGAQTGAVFTLYQNYGTATQTTIGTCTVQASGSCSPTFTNLQPGTYTLNETNTPAGYGKDPSLPYTFSLAAGETKALSFTDPASPGSLTITKKDDASTNMSGITFQIYNDQAKTSPVTGKSCSTDATGTCTITGITAGTYWVDETSVPTGYYADSLRPKQVTITKGTNSAVSFTNPRKFKEIVIVCQESNGTLYPSAITIDGTTTTSLSSSGATAAGLSQSALCGLTAGAKSGLRAAPDGSNPHSSSANIPNKQ